MNEADSSKSTSKRRTIVRTVQRIALAVGVVVAVFFIWRSFQPKAPEIDVVAAWRGPLAVHVRASGVTRIKDRVVISAPAYGQMARIGLRPGDSVTAGQLVTRITAAPSALLDVRTRAETEQRIEAARAAWRQAQTLERLARDAVDFAEEASTRAANLNERGLATQAEADSAAFAVRSRQADRDSAEFATRVARHQLDLVEATLDPETGDDGVAFDVTSPIDGVVLRVVQEHDAIVQPGMAIIEIGDPTAIEIVADVLTTDAVQIEPGSPVSIDRWGGESSLVGHIRSIEPQAFTDISALGVEEQRVNVVIDLDSEYALWQRLGDGWRVETAILLWSASDVLQVPLNSMFRRSGDWAVYVVEGDVITARTVGLGQRDGRNAQVVSGLNEGDLVVLYPSDALNDGLTVVPQLQESTRSPEALTPRGETPVAADVPGSDTAEDDSEDDAEPTSGSGVTEGSQPAE